MQKRKHWRSYADRNGTTEFLQTQQEEFPAGASEAPDGISRRKMLALMGASASLAGLASCRRPVEKIVPYVQAPEMAIPGIPRHYATAMPVSGSALGLIVESHEGRPTKIEGNPSHPVSRGATTTWAQAETLRLYDPDRSPRPMLAGEASDWEAFLGAWTKSHETLTETAGRGTAVLARPFNSPTLKRMQTALMERYPELRWVAYEPWNDARIRAGVLRATGRPLTQHLDLSKANVVLAIDADLFGSDPESVRHARDFSDNRRMQSTADGMNRLYVVEAAHTITGGMADHRMPLASSRIGAFVSALHGALRQQGLEIGGFAGGATGIDDRWVTTVAQDLLAARGNSLVVAGSRQPAEIHAAILAINEALGGLGRTMTLVDTPHAVHADPEALQALVASMNGGSIDRLICFDTNPVYDAPASLQFSAALANVAETIHFGYQTDETSALCNWHLNAAHFLESWGDVAAADGTLSVIQPLIAPLFPARADVEMLGILLNGVDAPGYDEVRATWTGLLGSTDDNAWQKVLHDGVFTVGSLVAQDVPVRADFRLRADGAEPGPDALQLEIMPSAALYDGRYANNSWLQELPDPVTKLTWGNVACLGPETARHFGLLKTESEEPDHNSQLVKLTAGETEIEIPVWVVPGQAEGTVVLSTGYGRTAAGRVAEGHGVDVYPLRGAADFQTGLTLAATGERQEMSCTQDHGSMRTPPRTILGMAPEALAGSLRPMVREATLEEFRAHPEFAADMVEMPPLEQLFGDHEYKGHKWGMTIDLNTCTGCNACVVACQAENNIPVVGPEQVRNGRELHWLRIDRYYVSDADDPARDSDARMVMQPVPCMHCENAPCEQVCPVAATVHDDEGLNVMVYNRCIGTRYCSNNCPYKVRRFNFFNYTKDLPKIAHLGMNPDVTVRSRGVMEKCSYCVQRISAAKIDARLDGDRPIADGTIQPACQQSCPTHAINFGDLADPQSAVVASKENPRNYGLLEELNNRPRTTYLARLRNPSASLEPAMTEPEETHHG